MVVLGKRGSIRANVVVFGQTWLYSWQDVVLGQSGCFRLKLLYSDKLVVFGQK